MSIRESFLAGPRPKVERVDIEGFGPVHVRAMSAGELGRFESWMSGEPDLENFLARFAIAGVCDESGTLAFTLDDVKALNDLDPAFLQRVQEAVARINKITKDEVEALAKKA